MSTNIIHDTHAPTATIELAILHPLPDYDIEDVDKPVPREVDGILVTQGFKDLVDDARSALDGLLRGKILEIMQLTGAICPDRGIFRPGLWIVLGEVGAAAGQPMSAAARASIAPLAEELRKRLGLD